MLNLKKKLNYRFLTLAIGLSFILSCHSKNTQKDEMKNILNTKTYVLNYDTNYCHEIFINGIRVAQDYSVKGQTGGLIYLNPFIESQGIQSLKIKLFEENKETKINANNLINQIFELYSYIPPMDESELSLIKKVDFESILPTQEVICSFQFEANISYDLPIKLENSKNLINENKDKLIEEVLEFYNNYSNLINKGDDVEYKKLFKNAHDREIISMFYDNQQKDELLNTLSKRIINSKNNVQPLEEYSLYFHPNNKIIYLQTTGSLKSPLYSKTKEKVRRFGVYLHKPKESNKLEVY